MSERGNPLYLFLLRETKLKVQYFLFVTVFMALIPVSAAAAMTNRDVTENLDSSHFAMFVTSSVEMAIYQYRRESEERARCMSNWIDDDGLRVIHENMHHYLDHAPQAVILVLLEQACPAS